LNCQSGKSIRVITHGTWFRGFFNVPIPPLQSAGKARTLEDSMTPHAKRKLIHYWRRQIRPILVLILVFTAFRSTVADWNDVPSGSMHPTIFTGDRIFVNKLAYGLKVPFTTLHLAKWSGPQPGEIAVFYSPTTGIRLVKRVVAIPGQTIEVRDNRLIIDGKPLAYTAADPNYPVTKDLERYHSFATEMLGDHPHIVTFDNNAPRNSNTLQDGGRVIPRDGLKLRKKGEDLGDGRGSAADDEYFMMGDNRDNSGDSRAFGPVPRGLILGRANRIIFSLDYDDHLLPRKSRFFHALH
jgi:signal peptidase I